MTGITKCRDNRNEAGTWYKECIHICENFSPINFSSFFTPNLQQFIDYNTFFSEQLVKMESELE